MTGFVQRWGRLLRLSLAATAVADVVAGSALAGVTLERPLDVLRLVGASLCVYHGGMALNDWADREVDARVRADRPIPSGAISAGTALAAALGLFLLGVLLALGVSREAGIAAGLVALLAAGYDLFGRGAWTGPLLLGLCRAGNLGLPLVAFAGEDVLAWGLAPLAYGAYVFVVSRLGRYEDEEESLEDGGAPRRLLLLIATILMLLPALPLEAATWTGRGAAWLLVVPATWTLWRSVSAVESWSRGQVERHMGLCLRRLLIASGALAALPGTPLALGSALLILLGYPLAHALRRVFPPS